MREDQGKPKIAVIAVHGVADQSPHDSARAIASLLLNHYWDGTSDEVAAEIDILIREACCETLKKRT